MVGVGIPLYAVPPKADGEESADDGYGGRAGGGAGSTSPKGAAVARAQGYGSCEAVQAYRQGGQQQWLWQGRLAVRSDGRQLGLYMGRWGTESDERSCWFM